MRCSCPKELFDLIANTYGTDNAYSMLLNSNEKAPLTIRVNPLKATREEVKINNNTIYIYIIRFWVDSGGKTTSSPQKELNILLMVSYSRGTGRCSYRVHLCLWRGYSRYRTRLVRSVHWGWSVSLKNGCWITVQVLEVRA